MIKLRTAIVLSVATAVCCPAAVSVGRKTPIAALQRELPGEVLFVSAAGNCGGLLASRWIISARHCADGIAGEIEHHRPVVVSYKGKVYPYVESELVGLLGATPPNKTGEALSLDFAMLPAPADLVNKVAPPDPTPSEDLRGKTVGFTNVKGEFHTCRIEAVCGAQVQIACSPEDWPARGTSGHFLYDLASQKPVAVLTDSYSSDNTGIATTYGTIMGRSSALSTSWNEMRAPPKHTCNLKRPDGRYCALSAEFARSARYRYPLEGAKHCRGPAVVNSRVSSVRVPASGFFTAAAIADTRTAIVADMSTGRLCLLDRTSLAVGVCRSLPAGFGRRVRSIMPIGKDQFVISGGSYKADANGPSSPIAVVTFTQAGGLVVPRLIRLPITQVVGAMRLTDDRILIGGTGGICVLEGAACRKLIWHERTPAESNWVVRGFMRSAENGVIAVGRDYWDDRGSRDPKRHRVEIARCWALDGAGDAFNYQRPCNFALKTAERLSELVSPMTILGEPIAFSSSGEAVSLRSNQLGRLIKFEGLMSSSRASSALDDVVRGTQPNKDGTITIISSDGSLRVLEVVPDEDHKVGKLVARDIYTAFDLAMWLVDLANDKDGAIVVAQSGEIYSVRWQAPNLY